MAPLPASSKSMLQKQLESISSERFIHYDLGRFTAALKHVGNPEKIVKTLVVAGTNGKGTTTLYLSSMLRENGFEVGTYLSPHLQCPSERLLHNLEPIAEEAMLALVEEYRETAAQFRLTYFEYLTLLCFIWAKRARLDFLVLEVGLGGRLDATNVTRPIASVITNIDWDHQQYLGNTLEAIFREKFAVVPPEGLCFTGIRQRQLAELLVKECDAIDTIYYFASELKTEVQAVDWKGQLCTINQYPVTLSCPSPGALESAALAFLTARIVFPRFSLESLQRGLASVKAPGRFELVQEEPRVILSGDHNPAGIDCLERTLKAIPRRGRLKIICAFSPDKPFTDMYARLKTMADEIHLTVVSDLRERLPSDYFTLAEVEENARECVERVVRESSREDTVLVTGSLYLIGEVRGLWRKRADFLTAPRLTPGQTSETKDASNAARPRIREVEQTPVRSVLDGAP